MLLLLSGPRGWILMFKIGYLKLEIAQILILLYFLVCNICNRLFQANAPAHRTQTSIKRRSLKFSSRLDLSIKFPSGVVYIV